LPNIVTFNTIMDCSVRSLHGLQSPPHGCGKTGRSSRPGAIHEASKRPWELVDQLTNLGLEPDRYTCSILVKGMHYTAASRVDVDRAIALLRRVGPSGLQPDSGDPKCNSQLVEVLFNTLLDICANLHDLDRMVEMFGMLTEFQVSLSCVTYSILIKAFGHAGSLERCHEVWGRMMDSKVKPTVVTYGCYINACIRSRDLETAESVFASMRVTKVRPNAVIFTSLIRGLAHAGEAAKAFNLYRQMRQEGVEPTSVTFNSVLDMVVRELSEPAILQSVLSDMDVSDAEPDAAVYTSLIKVSCEAGNVDKAMMLFRRRKRFVSSQYITNFLLLTCAQQDRIEDSEEVFEHMRLLRVAPNNATRAMLVKMYSGTRMPGKAEAVVKE